METEEIMMARSGNDKGSISVEASRKALLADLKKKCKGTTIRKKVPFINDDVPQYLEVLASLEESSRESTLTVK